MFDLGHVANWTEYNKLLFGLLAIVSPVSAIPMFIGLVGKRNAQERQHIILVATITSVIVLLLFTYFGEAILNFFGISLSVFKIAGGVLIFLSALDMLRAKASHDDVDDGEDSNAIAIVPLAIPILAGPGALSTVIIFSNLDHSSGHNLLMTLVIITVGVIVYALLSIARIVERALGTNGIVVVNRIMGLILAAIAIEFMLDGIGEHFLLTTIHTIK
jgi:multiple antibiotic resistance protein